MTKLIGDLTQWSWGMLQLLELPGLGKDTLTLYLLQVLTG